MTTDDSRKLAELLERDRGVSLAHGLLCLKGGTVKKILVPFMLLFVVVLGGTARAAPWPKCSVICSCETNCAVYEPCSVNGQNTTCQSFGKCRGGYKCTQAAAPLTIEALVSKAVASTAGDGEPSTTDTCATPVKTSSERPAVSRTQPAHPPAK